MSDPKPKADTPAQILFFPGHWHTTYHAQPLVEALSKTELTIKTAQLATVGRKEPRATFTDDVVLISHHLNTILDSGEDVVLVLHSYAGVPGSQAASKIVQDGGLELDSNRGRLRAIVYIAAFIFPLGVEMDIRSFVGPHNPRLQLTEDMMINMLEEHDTFCSDVPAEKAAPFLARIEETHGMTPDDKGGGMLITSDEFRKCNLNYILCEFDKAWPPERQLEVAEGMEIIRMPTAHDPFLSQPQKVSEILEEIAWRE